MRELFGSILRFSWAMSLLSVKEFMNMFSSATRVLMPIGGSAIAGLPAGGSQPSTSPNTDPVRSSSGSVSASPATPAPKVPPPQPATSSTAPRGNSGTSSAPGSPATNTGAAGAAAPLSDADLDSGWGPMVGGEHHATRKREINSGSLRAARFFVLGEGLAAGMTNFTLSSDTQQWSFPTQMAKQMGAKCPQRLLQSPGIGNAVGFPRLPVRLPAPPQTTVLIDFPPEHVSNLAIPELTLDDALQLQAAQPLIHRDNAKQTAANFTWGMIAISKGEASMPTQLQYAVQQSPTFTIVELGYHEFLEAAVLGDLGSLPDTEYFISQYEKLLGQLRSAGSQILVTTVPDPLDTAHFSSVDTAAKLLKIEPSLLGKIYSIKPDDLLTVNGLNEIGYQMFAKSIHSLPANSLLPSDIAGKISARVDAINAKLQALGAKYGTVYDLAALFRKIAKSGYQVNARTLTGEFLGGFYSLNGYYPGATGQAIIANEILTTLNRSYGSNYPMIDVGAVMATDSVAAYHQPGGPLWATSDLEKLASQGQAPSSESAPVQEVRRPKGSQATNDGWTPLVPAEIKLPLKLPPGLEQVLPLSKAASYFGDGIAPIDCHDALSMQWGSCGSLIFGGLAMVDSHLTGSIRIKFTPPVNDITHFEVSFEGGFEGEDAVLVTPQLFKMGFQQSRVDQVPGTISSGTLNLATGEVSDLSIYARYAATALFALVGINPTFPKLPLNFPGPYGYAWATFEQRPDGNLDFTFHGSTFVPLGKDISWPLNFVGPSGDFARIPAAGTVMHPHLALSTKEVEVLGDDVSAGIPFNTVQEFTLYTHNSAFGDAFTLNTSELGGPAKGRSHLMGRLQIQFGGKTGNSVPIAVWGLVPGGQMAELPESPITQAFPVPLSGGPQGFNDNLRFPLKTYPLDVLAVIDDPFDISVGAIDLRTGKLLHELLHRGFISQDLIYALLRVEPRTPKGSFYFKGPAVFTTDKRNQRVFRLRGITHLPYPEGFSFPRPDFATGFLVGADSALDPFLWFHAIQAKQGTGIVKQGGARNVRASTGDEFSYRYFIPSDPASQKAVFEYENHTQQGQFRMHSLVWLDFANSGTSESSAEEYDTVTFTGYGIWSKNGMETLQQASVQISTSSVKPYVGIEVALMDVSNANVKPPNEPDALP